MKLCVLLLVFVLGVRRDNYEQAKTIYEEKYNKYFNGSYVSIPQLVPRDYRGEMCASHAKIMFLRKDTEVDDYKVVSTNVIETDKGIVCEWECQTFEMRLRNFVRYSSDTSVEIKFMIKTGEMVKFAAGTNGLVKDLEGGDFIVEEEFDKDQQNEALKIYVKAVTNAMLFKFANEATLAYMKRK